MFLTITSILRWAFGLPLFLCWAVVLIALSYIWPMRKLRPLAKFAFRMTLAVFGLRVKVSGTEHIDPNKGYIYMSNHVSLFEPFIVGISHPTWVIAIEKQENFKIPFYGLLISRWGNIPIDRGNLESAKQSLERAKEALADGVSIGFMPEGTRTRNGELGPFKKGGFHTAIDAGAEIVPFAFRNLYQFNRTGSWLLTPQTVEVHFTAPIDSKAYGKEHLDALSDKVRSQIIEALEYPAGAPEGQLAEPRGTYS